MSSLLAIVAFSFVNTERTRAKSLKTTTVDQKVKMKRHSPPLKDAGSLNWHPISYPGRALAPNVIIQNKTLKREVVSVLEGQVYLPSGCELSSL